MKKRVRLFALFLTVAMLVGTISNSAAAIGSLLGTGTRTSEITYPSEQGWSLTFDSETGTITGFDAGTFTGGEVQLPTEIENVPVTKIGENAFREKRPASGTWTKLVLPKGLTEIGASAFWTAQIKSIELPDTLEIIGESAFRGSWVEQMTIPESVTEIGNYVWYDSSLKEIALLCKDAELGSTLFGHCWLSNFTAPEWMTDIGTVFRESNITSITLAAGTTAIPENAFEGCYELESVQNMGSVTSIAANAFANCSKLTAVDLSRLTTLGERAFYNCDQLNTVKLPETVTEIPKGAFQSANALSNVTLPSTLTTIGESAFEECSGLTVLSLPEDLTTIGKRAFAKSGLTSISIPSGVTVIADETFDSANHLVQVTLPATLEQIGMKAFYYTGLQEISIPAWVKTIGERAFSNCLSLSNITLQEGLTTLGAYVFEKTPALTKLELPDTVTDIGAYAFWQSGVTAVEIPEAMTVIGDQAFAVSNIQQVTFHEGVTRIGNDAFRESKLASIEFPQNLQSVGTGAFSCTPITTVTIPAGVAFDEGYSWSDGAFYECESLTSAVIEAGITRLSAFLFSHCKVLEDVSLPEGLTELGTAVFYDCDALADIALPDSLKVIGNAVFSECALTELTLPKNLERIETSAFQWSGIQEITIPASVAYVGYQAFCCRDLAHVYVYGRTTEFDRYAFLRDDGSIFNMWGNDDLVIHAYEGSTAADYMLTYGDASRLVYLLDVAQTRTLTASVTDEEGDAVTEGYTVRWYQQTEEGETPVGTGLVLTGALTDCAYLCEVVLEDALLEQYVQPERQRIDAGTSDETISFVLEKVPAATVSGRIVDRNGNAIPNASVNAGQNCTTSSGEDGAFVLAGVPRDGAVISVSKEGYYSKTAPVFSMGMEESGAIHLGDIVMYEAVGDRLLLKVAVCHAVAAGDTPRTENLTSVGGLDVSLTVNGSEILPSDYEIQGSSVLFQPNAVSAGQQIHVTVSDPNGRWLEGQAAVTLDTSGMGSASVTLQEKGAFTLDELTLPGQSNVLVFDENDRYITSYSAQAGTTSQPMDAGSYTLIFIQNTSMLQHVASLSVLSQLGLQDGTDYTSRQVAILDGVLTRVNAVTVPELSEDAFSYLESGGVSASTATAAQGTLVLITVQMSLSSGYEADQVQIYLPDNMSLLEGSVTLDNKVSAYTKTERMLTVPASGKGSATVRFYLAANDTGNAAVEAYVGLTNGALQPIGSVMIRNVQAEMDLPSTTSSKTILVTGKTIPDSTVFLYDNGILVGETTSNAVGSWSCSVGLAEPLYNYSYHTIHAEVKYQSNSPIRTGAALVIYDERVADLKTITMYSQNHITGETATVLDFTKVQTTKPYYYYWPDHMNYTFQVEFAKNARQLTAVTVVVTGANGETILIPATYDESTDTWLASYEFNSQNMPVSVGADYTMEELSRQYSLQKIVDAVEQTESLVDMAADSYDVVYAEDVQLGEADDNTLIYRFDIDQNDVKQGVLAMDLTDASGEIICRYTLREEKDTRSASELEQDGFGSRDKNLYVKFSLEDTGMQYEYVDLTERSRMIERYEFGGESVTMAARMLGILEPMDIDFTNSSWLTYEQIASQIVGALSLAPVFGEFASATQEVIETSGEQIVWRNELEGNYETLQAMLETARKLLDATCPDGSRRLPTDLYNRLKAVYDDLVEEIERYRKEGYLMLNSAIAMPLLESLISDAVDGFVSKHAGKIDDIIDEIVDDAVKDVLEDLELQEYRDKINDFLEKKHTYGQHISDQEFTLGEILEGAGIPSLDDLIIPDYPSVVDTVEDMIRDMFYTESPDGNVIDVGFMGFTVKFYTEQGIDNYINSGYEEYNSRLLDLLQAIRRNYQMCQTGEEKEIELSGDSQNRDLDPVYDPSGYVYEAVPSNRLEGVTATVYSKNSQETESVWAAEDYNQKNPQVTDADGAFFWFVPNGSWQVRFTKEGYESADSSQVPAAVENTQDAGWLPVPPPQFEVNVAMVSTAGPEVERVITYTDRIEVVFSQYMDINSVRSAISLGDADISVTPLDAEYDLEEENQYATRFSVVAQSGKYEGMLTIASSAKNYAGKGLSAVSSTPLSTPVQRPTAIKVDGNPAVVVHQSTQLTLTVEPGLEGQKLSVETLTPSLLQVAQQDITTGQDGTAAITVTGKLPGTGQIRVTEPVSELTQIIFVQIVMTEEDLPEQPIEPEPEKPNAVTATLPDGTPVTTGMTVEAGTQISLATTTAGAVIRYTLDDTCPCLDTALTYTDSIQIFADTVLRAAAQKDGVYSDTIRLELTVKADEPEKPNAVTATLPDGTPVTTGMTVEAGTQISLATTTAGAVIRYTLDDTCPCLDTALTYTDSIQIFADTVLRAAAQKDGVYSDTIRLELTVKVDEPEKPNESGSSGGSSASSDDYAISIEKTTGGKVTVSSGRAEKGDTVIITVSPDDGYTLDELCITTKKGDAVPLTNQGGGKYTFVMPGSPVEIVITFAKDAQKPDNPFTDVSPSDYYYDAVLWAVANGVTGGTSATTFSPNAAVTRAQAVTFLWRAHGSQRVAGSNPFTDVSPSDYYYDAVLWAVANGVTGGTSATTFSPNAVVTRAQAVTFQWRAADSPIVSGSSFHDVVSDAYYANAVMWAVQEGITGGTGNNQFSPEMPVSRGQAVTFLYQEQE